VAHSPLLSPPLLSSSFSSTLLSSIPLSFAKPNLCFIFLYLPRKTPFDPLEKKKSAPPPQALSLEALSRGKLLLALVGPEIM